MKVYLNDTASQWHFARVESPLCYSAYPKLGPNVLAYFDPKRIHKCKNVNFEPFKLANL